MQIYLFTTIPYGKVSIYRNLVTFSLVPKDIFYSITGGTLVPDNHHWINIAYQLMELHQFSRYRYMTLFSLSETLALIHEFLFERGKKISV